MSEESAFALSLISKPQGTLAILLMPSQRRAEATVRKMKSKPVLQQDKHTAPI
jgi:hypothetical protein